MAVSERAWIVVWVVGVILLAAAAGLGSRTAQTHVMARKAWLAASAEVDDASYDARESDALYAAAEEALETTVLLARMAGAGLILLVAGLLARRPRRGVGGRSRASAPLGVVAAALVWAILTFAAARATHPLLGPVLAHGLRAIAPFAAAAAGIGVWLLHRRQTAAKVPASTGDK